MSDLMMIRFAPSRRSADGALPYHPVAMLRVVLRTYLTRQALPNLTARELADIGLDPAAAVAEAARLPWDTMPGPQGQGAPGMLARLQHVLERIRVRRLMARRQAPDLSIYRA